MTTTAHQNWNVSVCIHNSAYLHTYIHECHETYTQIPKSKIWIDGWGVRQHGLFKKQPQSMYFVVIASFAILSYEMASFRGWNGSFAWKSKEENPLDETVPFNLPALMPAGHKNRQAHPRPGAGPGPERLKIAITVPNLRCQSPFELTETFYKSLFFFLMLAGLNPNNSFYRKLGRFTGWA